MKIICIGRNYADHIKEFDNGPLPEEPLFFLKPDTALLRNNEPFYMPSFSNEIHYETELVVRINRVGRSISERFAHKYYDEVGLGIDFTARDLQRQLAAKGQPWEKAKGFDYSAAVSSQFIKLSELGGDPQKLRFEMRLNGETMQTGDTSKMIFTVNKVISYVSQFITFRMGDLLFTGTPEGVGEVKPGDNIMATLQGHKLLDFDIK